MANAGTLLCSAQANGTSTAVAFGSESLNIRKSQLRSLFVTGTWDSATFKLQASADGGTTYVDVVGADSITVNKLVNVEVRCTHFRCVVSGGGGSESITTRLV